MSIILYNLGIVGYVFILRLAALFKNAKAQRWLDGRKAIFSQLELAFVDNEQPVIWVHCASLGEFEQGRPLIEALKQKTPNYKILLTFFSPSGYQVQKNYAQADWVFYLPIDSAKNAAKFIAIVQPKQVFFVKYEFWYHYLSTLKEQQIPTYLISAIFRPNQVFFKWYGGLFRQILGCFTAIFVQNKKSISLLNQLNYNNGILAGDTRLDRVISIKQQAQTYNILEQFCDKQNVLVCGSTWPEDERILAAVLQKNTSTKLVIAPHEIQEQHLLQIEALFAFTSCLRYSQKPKKTNLQNAAVLIIDNIGMLSSLYSYANAAYIGGGFGLGIHNSLEAAVFKIPVLFGGNYHKFQEAKTLIQEGIAFEVKNSEDVLTIIQQLQSQTAITTIQQKAQKYLNQHSGATSIILSYLDQTAVH